jgi:hypothetical protein
MTDAKTSTSKGARIAAYIAIAILVLIVGALVFIATRPETFHVERSAPVAAPSDVVFGLIDDFHRWAEWSPYEKLDPNMSRTYEGPSTGPGATYAWKGNNEAGEGRMTILQSTPGERVAIQLDFLKPFAATCQATFTLVPADAGTRVTWSMDGKNNFISKAMHLLMDMDKMVGQDFEQGLANLNTVAQAETQRLAKTPPAEPAKGPE